MLYEPAVTMRVVDQSAFVSILDLELLLARAVQDHIALLVGEVLDRRIKVEVIRLSHRP